VVLYTAVGGLKATFITDYLHTFIALVLMIWFTLGILASDTVGGLSGLYDKVVAAEAAGQYHIVGNYKGSLLTFKSKGAFIWGVLHCFGNLALMTIVFPPGLAQRGLGLTHIYRTLLSGKSHLLLRFRVRFQATILPQ
jgi:Na+/proline symporter